MNINTINGMDINGTDKRESLSIGHNIETNGDGVKMKKDKKSKDRGEVDTSNFSIEERLISAVWVHDKKLMRSSITDIKLKFRTRFGKDPPAKNTLYLWEKKLFSTGNVMDAKRSGRPCRRKDHLKAVEASLKDSPGLSLRARANQLGLTRSTLLKIVQDDLKVHYVDVNKPKKTEPMVATNANNGIWIKSKKNSSLNRRKSKETGSKIAPVDHSEPANPPAPHSPEPAPPQPSLPSFPPPPPSSDSHQQCNYGGMVGAHFPPYMHGYSHSVPPPQAPNLHVNHHLPPVLSRDLQNVDSQQYGPIKNLDSMYGQAAVGQVVRTALITNEYNS